MKETSIKDIRLYRRGTHQWVAITSRTHKRKSPEKTQNLCPCAENIFSILRSKSSTKCDTEKRKKDKKVRAVQQRLEVPWSPSTFFQANCLGKVASVCMPDVLTNNADKLNLNCRQNGLLLKLKQEFQNQKTLQELTCCSLLQKTEMHNGNGEIYLRHSRMQEAKTPVFQISANVKCSRVVKINPEPSTTVRLIACLASARSTS